MVISDRRSIQSYPKIELLNEYMCLLYRKSELFRTGGDKKLDTTGKISLQKTNSHRQSLMEITS